LRYENLTEAQAIFLYPFPSSTQKYSVNLAVSGPKFLPGKLFMSYSIDIFLAIMV
jgi:hypothetical protein